jgi:hypothetical protein
MAEDSMGLIGPLTGNKVSVSAETMLSKGQEKILDNKQ